MLRLADTVLGSDLLQRVSEFLLDLRTTYDGVSRRGREIESVLSAAEIVVITTADPAPMAEAVRFFRELPELASEPGGVVFNRSLPSSWAEANPDHAPTPELAGLVRDWRAEALRQADARAEFAARYGAPVSTVSLRPEPIKTVDQLGALLEGVPGIEHLV